MNERRWLPLIVFCVSIVGAGALVGRGIERFRAADRSVSVKGVAERTVQADVGLWPLRVVVADADPRVAHRKIEHDRHVLLAFLTRFGLGSTRTELPGLERRDPRANQYPRSSSPRRVLV